MGQVAYFFLMWLPGKGGLADVTIIVDEVKSRLVLLK